MTIAPALTSSTFGWDTVFAIPVDRVNKAIADRKASATKLVFPPTGPYKFQVQADFDDWRVIPEGDGAIVRMALPMRNLIGSYDDAQGQTQSISCAELVGIIEIKLNFLPHDGLTPLNDASGNPLPPPDVGTKRHLLQARTESDDAADPVINFVTMQFTKPLTPSTAKISVERAFETWCVDNIEDFTHVFAVVDLNTKIATGRFAFCKPHTTNYAIVDTIDKTASYLGILCMTSNDPVPDVQQISALAVPAKCSAGFCISPRRMLEDIAKPSMTSVWPKLNPNDLTVDSSNLVMSLNSGINVELPDITSKGDTYTPVMTDFSLEIMGDELKIDTHMEIEVSPGIYATCTSTYYYKMSLGTNSNGEPAITYVQSRSPVKATGQRSSPGIVIAQAILTIIALVLAVLALVVDPAISIVIGVILAGIAVGQYEMNNLGYAHSGDAPGLGDLTSNFTAPITWTDSKDFTLQSVGMNESLQLGGTWN